jgi:CrcB protein
MKIVALSYVFVGAGGALGAMARYALNIALQRGVNFPWGTLSANLLGCLILGVVAQLVASSEWFNNAGIIPDQYRLLFAVGFCGSFTTLSALVLELHTMLQRNEFFASFLYVMASVIGGFAFFLAGFMLLRMFRGVA